MAEPTTLTGQFDTLLRRWMISFVGTTLIIVGLVAVVAWTYTVQRTNAEMEERLKSIAKLLAHPSFPLNRTVLETIHSLTQADLILVDASGDWLESNLDPKSSRPIAQGFLERSFGSNTEIASVERRLSTGVLHQSKEHAEYWVRYLSPNQPTSLDGELRNGARLYLGILIPESQVTRARRQSIVLPILTGTALILAIGLVASWQVSRIVKRIRELELLVDRIGHREYGNALPTGPHDELGKLADGIHRMEGLLKSSEESIKDSERERLIAQFARGMAHDLRNTLSGARLAIQCHSREMKEEDAEGLKIATQQLRIAEDQLRSLMQVGQEGLTSYRELLAAQVDEVLNAIKPMIEHWKVELIVKYPVRIQERELSYPDTLRPAIYNLMLNAIHAAGENGRVELHLSQREENLLIEVRDSGPGPDATIAERMFEPMVTTKPEGMGMGLAMVRRTANELGGEVFWERLANETRFQIVLPFQVSHT